MPVVPTSDAPVVEALAGVELAPAVAATSRAFWPDPMFGFFARNDVQEHRMLPHFIGAVMADAHRHGIVDVVRRNGRVVGTASWHRPGEMPRGAWRETKISARCAVALVRGRNRITGLRLLSAMDARHPHDPHWYLALLGVDPSCQRSGLGTVLLRHRLDRCDDAGEAAYLETQKPENVPYYERHGFVVRDTVTVADSPPVWLMWRDPR